MNRAKRFRRGSTADRASVDTTTSSASTSSTQQPSQKKVKVEDGTGREPSAALSDHQPASPSTADLVEELFTAVVQQLGTDFSLLPSRKEYPDYYEMTAKPIDLKQIAMKIQKSEYAGLEGLVEDLTLLANNAIDYNIPSSQIYKEAAMLKKFVANKKVEYEQRELHRTKERTVRTRRSTAQATQPVSAVFAALEYGEDDDSEGRDDAAVEDGAEEETMEADSEDEDGTSQDTGSIITRADGGGDDKTAAMLELFTSVVKLKGTTNKPMSGPFMKLPSKRMYPIYYTTIVSPIALSNIKSKIKNGLYLALDEMFVDLLLMCQNAQTFNDNNSIIYRNSERIKKFVEARQKEFQDEVQKKSSALRTALSERLWPEYDDSLQRKRAKYLVRSLLECRQGVKYFAEDFLEKPAKKEYPDYYDVITQPVDLKTLVKNVLGDKYLSEEALLVDLDLLCSNAKLYNEEGSDIFEAAVKLEETIKRAQKTLDAHLSLSGVAASGSSSPRRVAGPSSSRRALTKFPAPSSPLQAALIELYEHVTDVTDPEEVGRKLCEMFQTLPLKTEMPSYYEVIKKPVDLDRIQYRIIHDQYRTFSEAIEDFGQMFENAAAFNEPTSAIYRDALVLLYAVMEKSSAMPLAFTEIPNVQQKVQEIIRALMDSVINLVKPDGRNVSETIAECAWNDSDSESEASNSHGSARTALTLESIKANVYAGRYRRLDRFQDDMFELLEKARFTAQPDSQTYEDAVDLHIHFITTRDELCGNGAKLLTPALHYNVSQFNASIEQERKEAKLRPPSLEPSRVTPPPPSTSATVAAAVVPEAPSQILPPMDPNAKCVMIGVDAFYAGDFVYVEPYDKGKQPLIVCIEEFVEQNGDLSVRGSYMLRPEETFHLANRRFYEKEVFKSDMAESHLPGRIRGRCFVMSGKDYFKLRPVGLDAKDVYVCDTRYSTRTKSFQKIKVRLQFDIMA
ncbi:Protein polybromo-1 [Hypsibius exemplaris]|uniref:Protein polybromo-1 n=1 Tax=Hypsibius exemplaris TaxID=2072580 RepID=A0A1W0X5J8_HYPEX|nr:Protein polybromo-1 [Hypsibius exemplaris]